MSYESAIADLKKLMKHELFDIPAPEYRDKVRGESDRACIIMNGSMLERFLVHELTNKMPSINSDGRSTVFQFEGPCGSFSNRIRMAQALGIIDRGTRKRLDLIREMRNVAAHAHADVGFQTPEIRAAVLALFDVKHRELLGAMLPPVLRRAFEYLCSCLNLQITGDDQTEAIEAMLRELREAVEAHALASPDKSPRQKPRGRPRKDGKGKPPARQRKPSPE